MAAYLVKAVLWDVSCPGDALESFIVMADSAETAARAMMSHVPSDPEVTVEDVTSVERLAQSVLRSDGTEVSQKNEAPVSVYTDGGEKDRAV